MFFVPYAQQMKFSGRVVVLNELDLFLAYLCARNVEKSNFQE